MRLLLRQRVARLSGGVKAPDLTRACARAIPRPMAIYKIFREGEWAALCHDGETLGAPIDRADGFVHFSTAEQLLETAQKHFAGETGLVVLRLDETLLGKALRWEPSRGGQLFPHLYRPMRLADVHWARPMGAASGQHMLPDGVE